MDKRPRTPGQIETKVVLSARRRCCLCVFLEDKDTVRKGQIAHLNRDRQDFRFDNLVWLCFDHHDEYDGRTSQAKGLTRHEVKAYRDKLYAMYAAHPKARARYAKTAETKTLAGNEPAYEKVRRKFARALNFTAAPWRFPLWQVENRPELFAYKAGNEADGICLIERIDLPDQRIVVAAIGVTGNPGNSITNCVEELCFQVCARFEIPANRLVWLEHYDYYDDAWNMVTFSQTPPVGPFAGPTWTLMTEELWRDLRLRPKNKLTQRDGDYESKLIKEFKWPSEALF